jgi:hypothetical protein
MPDEQGDFIAKLRQIEESASIAVGVAQLASVKGHLRHIVLVSKALRMRLEIGIAQVIASSPAKAGKDPDKDHPG